MKKYVIITDSSSNLSFDRQKEFGVDAVLPIHLYIKDKKYDCNSDWTDFSAKEFYDLVRSGEKIRSSQVLSDEYERVFRGFLENGYDILSLSCCKALSNSVGESIVAAKKLEQEFPDAKIYCVDTYNCCFSLAMMIKDVAKMRENGKSIDEARDYALSSRGYYNEAGTVADLSYLRAAGRVSGAAAFFGGVFSVKPIIVYDETGHNAAFEKVRGRKRSLERVSEIIARYADLNTNNTVYVAHADCEEEAKLFSEMLQSAAPDVKIDFVFDFINPGIGFAVGPGTLIVDFYGDPAIRKLSE